jgi:SGNH domain (fused to AT3 domains)
MRRHHIPAALLAIVSAGALLANGANAAVPPPTVAPSVASVTTAVARAAAATTIPAVLTPTLANVVHDGPGSFTGGTGRAKPAKLVVVFGDSHAWMWFPALVSGLGSTFHLSLNWLASCPPAAVAGAGYGPSGAAACSSWRTSTIASIIASKPYAVILAERSDYVFTSPGVVATPDQWTTGLESTITAFATHGIKVVVIGDDPTYTVAFSPASCVARSPVNLAPCDPPVATNDPKYQSNAAAEQRAAQATGATFINTVPLFCTATVCPVIINNQFVYYDWSHITATYSLYLAKVIAQETNLLAK